MMTRRPHHSFAECTPRTHRWAASTLSPRCLLAPHPVASPARPCALVLTPKTFQRRSSSSLHLPFLITLFLRFPRYFRSRRRGIHCKTHTVCGMRRRDEALLASNNHPSLLPYPRFPDRGATMRSKSAECKRFYFTCASTPVQPGHPMVEKGGNKAARNSSTANTQALCVAALSFVRHTPVSPSPPPAVQYDS